MSHPDFRLSLVVPVYNEEESIDAFINAIDNELAPLKDQLEIVFVNDGSRDRTREVVEQAIARDPRVTARRGPGPVSVVTCTGPGFARG